MTNNDPYAGREYYFINADRPNPSDFEVGTVQEIFAGDAEGKNVRFSFRVTRNAQLGSYQRRIYGQLLEPLSWAYEQVEIRFHKDHPEYDTIEVFPQAPPAGM